jgi:hypothetical protein
MAKILGSILLRWGIAILVALSLLLLPFPVQAAVHVHLDAGDRPVVRSLQTVRDSQDRAWQAVLFKRGTDGPPVAYLRLVGFPGQVYVSHPQPLSVAAGPRQWQLPDVFSREPSLTPNVGEYDATQLLRDLEGTPPLELGLGQTIKLTIPPFVLREWQQVLATDELP